jgi:hypothetical protein
MAWLMERTISQDAQDIQLALALSQQWPSVTVTDRATPPPARVAQACEQRRRHRRAQCTLAIWARRVSHEICGSVVVERRRDMRGEQC